MLLVSLTSATWQSLRINLKVEELALRFSSVYKYIEIVYDSVSEYVQVTFAIFIDF